MGRSTIVVPARLLLDAVTMEHVRAGTGLGLQVLPVAALAERLTSGFLGPVDTDDLLLSFSAVLADLARREDMGNLWALNDLPGLRGTLAATLERTWSVRFDLTANAARHPPIAALARIETAVLAELPGVG